MGNLRIITFPSVQHALKAEKLVRKEGIAVAVINTPRHISSDCGISLKFEDRLESRIREVLKEGGVEYQGIYMY